MATAEGRQGGKAEIMIRQAWRRFDRWFTQWLFKGLVPEVRPWYRLVRAMEEFKHILGESIAPTFVTAAEAMDKFVAAMPEEEGRDDEKAN